MIHKAKINIKKNAPILLTDQRLLEKFPKAKPLAKGLALGMGVVGVCMFVFLFLPSVTHAAVVSGQPSNRGLVGYWSFNEATSTTAGDFSGNGYIGTLNGPTWTNGKKGKAISLDGNDSRVTVSSTRLTKTGSMSISAWIKISSAGSNMVITNKGDSSGIVPWLWFYYAGGSNIFALWNANGNGASVSSTVSVEDNRWHHVVVSAPNGGALAFYLDGVDVTAGGNNTYAETPTATSTLASSYPFEIGARTRLGAQIEDFTGTIDEVRVYNRALSAADVLYLYSLDSSVQKLTNKTGLIADWTFDEGTSTRAGDFSGNNIFGTLSSNPTWTTGKHENALDFAGSGSVTVSDNDNLDFGTGSFSVSMWGYYRDFTYPKAWFMIKKSNTCYTGGASPGWDIGHNYQSTGISICYSDGANLSTNGTVTFDAGYRPTDLINKWAHLVAVFDKTAGRVKFYVNGVKQTNEYDISTVTGTVNNSSSLSIGTMYGWQTDGKIDEVKIYNRALSLQEVGALYRGTAVSVNTTQNNRITDGLVGLWSFNGADVADKVYDRSAQGNNGYVYNTATSSAKTLGKVGQALQFDGVNDYVEIPASSVLDVGTTVTVSTWMYRRSNVTTYESIVNHIDKSTPYSGYWLGSVSDGRLRAFVGPYTNAVDTTATVSNDTWHHVALVSNGTTFAIYVDGVKASADQAVGSITATNVTTRIGLSIGPTEYFDGKVDEVRIYNRALSATEVKQLYLMGK